VDVEFRTRQLQRAYEDERLAIRWWGPAASRVYGEWIVFIQEAESAADLYTHRRMRFHPLHGDRAAQFAMHLAGRWRLIVALHGATVVVEEVSRHYDD